MKKWPVKHVGFAARGMMRRMSDSPPFAAEWCSRWKSAAVALERVHDDELRALSAAEALRRTEALLSMAAPSSVVPSSTSGFIAQQAAFSKLRP